MTIIINFISNKFNEQHSYQDKNLNIISISIAVFFSFTIDKFINNILFPFT